MATTTNYSWTTPDDTGLVKDGASAIRTLGSSADTTVKALNPGTTAGDVDYYTAATTKARVAIGTAGQVLTVNSGATAPEWATPASGGMTLISTTNLASVTSITSIPTTYKNLILVIRGFRPTTNARRLRMRLNNDSGTSYTQWAYATANINVAGFGSSGFDLTDNASNGGSNTNAISIISITDYANTTGWQFIDSQSVYQDSSAGLATNFAVYGAYIKSAAITQIDLFANTGSIDGGSALLYGVN